MSCCGETPRRLAEDGGQVVAAPLVAGDTGTAADAVVSRGSSSRPHHSLQLLSAPCGGPGSRASRQPREPAKPVRVWQVDAAQAGTDRILWRPGVFWRATPRPWTPKRSVTCGRALSLRIRIACT
jgi:hypothetical protein